jgi:pimeloyl-ACP methyl ester carboxylesterase
VLAVDVRGRGRSAYDPDPQRYVAPTYAADVALLMARAGIDRAVLVGTSMGGLITMVLAATKPKLIAAAVLNDVGPELDPRGLARIAGYVGGSVEVNDWADAAAYAKRINGAALPHYTDADWAAFARRTFKEDASGRPVLDYDPNISVPFKTAKPVLPSVMWGLYKKLAKGRPLLIVRGENSDILARTTAARMVRSSKTATLTEIPGVGHAPMLDEPHSRSALEAFLSTAP